MLAQVMRLEVEVIKEAGLMGALHFVEGTARVKVAWFVHVKTSFVTGLLLATAHELLGPISHSFILPNRRFGGDAHIWCAMLPVAPALRSVGGDVEVLSKEQLLGTVHDKLASFLS
jgi:hypothetical protein